MRKLNDRQRAFLCPALVLTLGPVAASFSPGNLAYVINALSVLALVVVCVIEGGIQRPGAAGSSWSMLVGLVLATALFHGLLRGNDLRYLIQDCFWAFLIVFLPFLPAASPATTTGWFKGLGLAVVVHLGTALPRVLSHPFDRATFFGGGADDTTIFEPYLVCVPACTGITIMLLALSRNSSRSLLRWTYLVGALSVLFVALSVTRTYFIALAVGLLGYLLFGMRNGKGPLIAVALSLCFIASGAWEAISLRLNSDDATELGGRSDEVEQLLTQLSVHDEELLGRGLGGVFQVWRTWREQQGIVPHIEPLWFLLKAGYGGVAVIALSLVPLLLMMARMLRDRRPEPWAAISLLLVGFSAGNFASPMSWAVWMGIVMTSKAGMEKSFVQQAKSISGR